LGDLANFEAPVVDFTFSAQSGTLYFSFLAEASLGGFSQPFVSGSANHHSSASVGMDTRSSDKVTARLVSSDGSNAAISGDLENAVGGLTFVVGKLFKSADGNYDRLQMEFNPTTKTEPVVWDADLTGDIGVASVSRFGIRFGEATGTEYAWIDEIRIGTTWADVLPPPSGTVVSIK
jgi:hypothetical protein